MFVYLMPGTSCMRDSGGAYRASASEMSMRFMPNTMPIAAAAPAAYAYALPNTLSIRTGTMALPYLKLERNAGRLTVMDFVLKARDAHLAAFIKSERHHPRARARLQIHHHVIVAVQYRKAADRKIFNEPPFFARDLVRAAIIFHVHRNIANGGDHADVRARNA